MHVNLEGWSCRVLRSAEDLEQVKEFWTSCETHRDSDFDFFRFVVERFPGVVRPHVIALYYGNKATALLVGRLEASRLHASFGGHVWEFPRMRIFQFVATIGEISKPKAQLLVNNIVATLAAGEADVAVLHGVPADSEIIAWARKLPPLLSRDHRPRCYVHRSRAMSGGSLIASLSQNERYQQRKRGRKIAGSFPNNRIQLYQTIDELSELVRNAEIVAKKTYQRGLGVGFSRSPIIQSSLEFEARKNWLRGYVLFLDESPAAFWIGCLRGGTFLSEYTGFDPAYREYAPGMYLMLSVMEELSSISVGRLDFGPGDAPYKERLASETQLEYTAHIFAASPKAISANGVRITLELCSDVGKKLLGKARLSSIVKRRWRALLARQPGERP